MFFQISGFLLLLIIVLLIIASVRYGYETFSELNPEMQMQKISENPKKFRIGTIVVILEHVAIITLAFTLFFTFGAYNVFLGFVWLVSRGIEGLVQIYNKKNYWSLLDISSQYSSQVGAEKEALNDMVLSILKSKNSTFSLAQILFSIGTLAYSLLFAIYAVIPVFIGWFGIVSSIIYGLGNGIARIKPDSKALWNLGGLLIWIFELILGGWLLFSPLFT